MDNEAYTGREVMIAVIGALLGSPVSLALGMLTGSVWLSVTLGFFGLFMLSTIILRPGR